MFLRLLGLLLVLVTCYSCDFMSPGKTALQNKVMIDTVINYNSVDTYPLFIDCNNFETPFFRLRLGLCFEMELLRQLQHGLKEANLTAGKVLNDTVHVDIMVDTNGKVSLIEIHKPAEVEQQLPALDSLLHRSIAALPSAIQPSLKRGIPVNTMFKLPIVLTSKR